MKFILNLSNLLFIFIFFCQTPIVGCSLTLFDEVSKHINQNLDEDKAELNVGYIDSILLTECYNLFNCYEQGKIIHLLGVSYYLLDQEKYAIKYFKKAVSKYWHKCLLVPESERANTIFNIGVAYQYTDEPYMGKQYINQALLILEKDSLGTSLSLAQYYQGAGNYFADLRDVLRAESYFQNALNLYLNLEDVEIEIFDILNRLIILNIDFERYDQANDYFEKALAHYSLKSSLIPKEDLSMIYFNGAKSLVALGKYVEAKEKCIIGMRLIDVNINSNLYSIGLEIMGVIEKESGNIDSASYFYQKVLSMRTSINSEQVSDLSKSIAFENLSGLHLKNEDYAEALIYANEGLRVLCRNAKFDKNVNPVINESSLSHEIDILRLLSLKSEIYWEKYKNENQESSIKMAVNIHLKMDSIINNSISSYQFELSKLQIYKLIVDYYGSGIEYALSLYEKNQNIEFLHRAYYFSSKSKALILQSQISAVEALQAVVPPDLIKTESNIVRELNNIKNALSVDKTNRDSLLNAYGQAQLRFELFIENLERTFPEYYSLTHAYKRPLEVREIQNKLKGNYAVIEYFYSDKNIFCFWISKNDFFYISLENNQSLNDKLNAFITQCRSPVRPFSYTLSNELYVLLLEDGLKRIGEDINKLFLIPDAILHSLPFEALVTTVDEISDFLISQYDCTSSYSSRLLMRDHDIGKNIKYVGFGSEYNKDLTADLKDRALISDGLEIPNLGLAGEEVRNSAALYDGDYYLNSDATIENLIAVLGSADILHISLHGLVDYDDSSNSCIVFDNNESEFVLRASDLYRQAIKANLVLLSSCHSASGQIYRGEGVQGMSKAFLLAGAGNIVSSLWSASERSSASILASFLAHVKGGEDYGASLQNAKLDYLKAVPPSQRHPFYWANYILIGDLPLSSTNFHLNWLLFGVLFLGIAILLFRERLKIFYQ